MGADRHSCHLSPTGLSPCLATLIQRTSARGRGYARVATATPGRSRYPQDATTVVLARLGFRLFPVRSPLLRESRFCFFSSRYLDVSVPSLTFLGLFDLPEDILTLSGWVAPFGDLRIKACLQLPGAFRCWPRPSSAVNAKASTVCLSSFFRLSQHLAAKHLRHRRARRTLQLSRFVVPLVWVGPAGGGVVEMTGLEPVTPCVQSRRSPN